MRVYLLHIVVAWWASFCSHFKRDETLSFFSRFSHMRIEISFFPLVIKSCSTGSLGTVSDEFLWFDRPTSWNFIHATLGGCCRLQCRPGSTSGTPIVNGIDFTLSAPTVLQVLYVRTERQHWEKRLITNWTQRSNLSRAQAFAWQKKREEKRVYPCCVILVILFILSNSRRLTAQTAWQELVTMNQELPWRLACCPASRA